VQGFREIPECTPEQLRATTTGFRLHELLEYWSSRPPAFFGMTIYLADERWLDEVFIPEGRSRGESWIVVRTPEQAQVWLTAAPEDLNNAESGGTTVRPGRGSRTVPLTLRFEVFRRDDFRCTYCGRKPPEVVLHVDHVNPWSLGGRTNINNLRTACSDCDLGKGARKLPAARLGRLGE
jgi:hypothetical protein